MISISGRVALITGAASGIGRASSLLFAKKGASIIAADISVDAGEETVRMIKKAGGEAIFVKTDVTKSNEVEMLVNKAVEVYGRLDCAHNNAGIRGANTSITECTEENWDRVMNINLKGVWLCMKYEMAYMARQGHGAIVNTSSALGMVGGSITGPAYVASKHGVVGLTRNAAVAYATAGIRVNAVCPGAILTPMTDPTNPSDIAAGADENRISQTMPIGRFGEPEEIAEAVVWLCSDAASLVTGCIMTVDGGWTAK